MHQRRFSYRLYWEHNYWRLPFVLRFEFVMNCMVRYSLLSSMNHGFTAQSSSLQFHLWVHLCYAHASDSVELSYHGSSYSSWRITIAQSPATIRVRCSQSSKLLASSKIYSSHFTNKARRSDFDHNSVCSQSSYLTVLYSMVLSSASSVMSCLSNLN